MFIHFAATLSLKCIYKIEVLQGRSQDFSKGMSQRLLTRSSSGDRLLYMVYTAAFPRVSARSVVLLRHEGPY